MGMSGRSKRDHRGICRQKKSEEWFHGDPAQNTAKGMKSTVSTHVSWHRFHSQGMCLIDIQQEAAGRGLMISIDMQRIRKISD